tara:strand:- start:132 stop:377 length:246 start_codon:yes stop_codon:yes gene_type:complete
MGVKKEKLKKKDRLYRVVVIYIGTIFMMISPFFIDTNQGKIGMLIGLTLITVQTQRTKQYNLSLLNFVGFCGYLYSLIKTL